MIVKPICAAYDVNRKFGFNATEAITIEHEEDFKTRFIDLFLYENNVKNAVDISGATVTARMVTTPEFDSLLLNDNVSCSVGEKQGHIVVPIDKAVLPSYPCEFLVEIHIENGEDVLVLPFPLWVKMNASILDDAGVTPESKGTVPELLEEATQALNDFNSGITGKKLYIDGDSIMYGYGANGYAIGEYLRDKYNMKLTKGAVTGATLSTSFNNNICSRMTALSEDYDVIIFDGGVNDKSKNLTVGAMTNGFDDFDTNTTIGALETICRHLALNYENAMKIFVITHEITLGKPSNYTRNKSLIEYMENFIPILNKWGIHYINMLDSGLKAFNENFSKKYFLIDNNNPNGDRIHPNLAGYKTFYFDKIEKALLFGAYDN